MRRPHPHHVTDNQDQGGQPLAGRLEGQVTVITGGAGFIGAAITSRFGQEGASVVVADLDVSREAEFVAGLDVPDPARISFVETNARDDASVRAMVAEVIRRHGRIDSLVALVGGSSDALIHKMTDEQWDRVMDLNLRTTFLAARAVIPHMIERGTGKLVLMSSRSYQGNVGQANYAAAKAGIIGLTSPRPRDGALQGQRELRRARVHRQSAAREHAREVPPVTHRSEPVQGGRVSDRRRQRDPVPRLGRVTADHRPGDPRGGLVAVGTGRGPPPRTTGPRRATGPTMTGATHAQPVRRA